MKNSSALLLGALISTSFTANAAIISGWGTYSNVSTNSNCPSYCNGNSSFAEDGLYEGGAVSSSSSISNSSGDAQASSALSGSAYTPVLRAASTAGATSGAFASAFAVQGFTYTGTADTTLTLDFSLHGINSSNDSFIQADFAILRGNDLYFYPDFGTQVYEAGWDMIDSVNGVESVSDLYIGTAGEYTLSTFFDINLSAGDDFFVVSSLRTNAERGASADALNTLTMQFNDASQLQAASVSAVPVPAAVWLFASGLLGLMGVARRKAA